ncbi:protein FAM217A [Rhynchocyon petersi]
MAGGGWSPRVRARSPALNPARSPRSGGDHACARAFPGSPAPALCAQARALLRLWRLFQAAGFPSRQLFSILLPLPFQCLNHLEVLLDPLVLERNLSEHANKIQNSQQGIFQLWSYPLNKESTMESRDFKVSSEENGLNVTSNSVRLFTPNQSLTSATVDQQVVAYPGLQQPAPLDLCWAYADGDFCKNRNEPPINLCSAIESSSSETSTALNWNFKYGNNNLEEIVTDESDLSENEKTNDTLPTYFKKMDLNLKPETIENFEESFTEEPSDIFPYPDFLPPPFSTLDLHKLALSKSENWKAAMEPPESSIEHLITRLLEMERLQHITIQKEKPRLQSNLSTPAVTERPPSKAMPKVRQPKFSDSLTLPTPCVEKSKEKRKNNSGSCKLEQNHSKWNWNSVGKYRWNSRQASLKTSFTTKQVITTYDDFKSPPNSILNPSQELSTKPSIAQTTQSLVKIVPAGCLPTRSPASALPITLSFSEHQREEINPPRTKKKLYQKNIVLNRPFCVQKLNCLSPSFIAKGKCSPIDQK